MAEAKKTSKKEKAVSSKQEALSGKPKALKAKTAVKQAAKTTVKESKTVKKSDVKDVKTAEAAATKEVIKKVEEMAETEAIAQTIVQAETDLALEQELSAEAPDASTLAKAGKRSAKAIKEDAEKQAKEERKKTGEKADPLASGKPKQHKNPTRSRLERAGKKLREASKLIDPTKEYNLKEAMELATKTSTTKFDATVEMHINLDVDPRQADQNVRDNLVLPAGTGKNVRVAVFGEADDVTAAKKAGADIAGGDDFLQQLDKGKLDFDVLIATPTVMAKLGKYARVLGPKGLMPNPKSGTVTKTVTKAVEEAKAGRVEYRVDSTGIVHLGIGKVSFGPAKLLENAQAVSASLRAAKPASVKSTYVKAIHVSTSMGPSIRVSTSEI